MDSQKIVKFVIVAAVLLLAAPFLMRLLPEPVTFDRAKLAFGQAGLSVSDFQMAATPGQRAVAEAYMMVNGVSVSIFQFDHEGKISTAMEYQKKDAGSVMVESMNLAQNLGAAVRKETPSRAVRRGMFMLVATGQDQAMVNRIADVFESM
jgi:hypothetical protein